MNNEIERIFKDEIIRPSKSPYNSPIWVGKKKGIHEDGTQKLRMVIDYEKLNENTVYGKHPISDCTVILSNLGTAK